MPVYKSRVELCLHCVQFQHTSLPSGDGKGTDRATQRIDKKCGIAFIKGTGWDCFCLEERWMRTEKYKIFSGLENVNRQDHT